MITDVPRVKCQKIDRCWELKFHEFRLRFNPCTWKISHITARDIVEPTIVDNAFRGYVQDFSRARVKCHHKILFLLSFLRSLAAGHFGVFLDVSPKIIIIILKNGYILQQEYEFRCQSPFYCLPQVQRVQKRQMQSNNYDDAFQKVPRWVHHITAQSCAWC